ncbi:MAG: carbazole 1,9a-dioxygenase terminal dioxygenase component, partial [Gammaproteobacteria bacterium]
MANTQNETEIDEKTPQARGKLYQTYVDAELGLREHWYPAFYSGDLKDGETRAEMMLGERIYFKRAGGKVYAVEDRCAHRGAPFSARPECHSENTISCPIHGFTYDVRDGKLVNILSLGGDSPLIGKVSVPSYPVEEKFSLIWVYIGDAKPGPLKADVLPSLWNTPDLVFAPTLRTRIRANWRIAIENGFDTGHLYLHRNWDAAKRYNATPPIGAVHKDPDELILVEEPGSAIGMIVASATTIMSSEVEGVRVSSPQVGTDIPAILHENFYPKGFGAFLPCGLDVPAFPLEGNYHWEFYVPVDEEHHMYFILNGAQVKNDEEKEAFYERHKTLSRDMWIDPAEVSAEEPEGFNNADVLGREAFQHVYQNENFWHRENLYQADYAIMKWRYLVARHAGVLQTRSARQFAKPTRNYPED